MGIPVRSDSYLLRILMTGIAALLLTGTQGGAVAQALPSDVRTRLFESVVELVPFDSDAGEYTGTSGSGTVVTPDGYVLTNYHVIGDDVSGEYYPWHAVYVTDPQNPDREAVHLYWARFVEGDAEHDLAIVKIDRLADESPLPDGFSLTHADIGDSDELTPGDPITVLGFPGIGGYTMTVTTGIVSGWLGEDLMSGGRNWIKTDARIAGGNSGGGAFDATGSLIAIPTGRSFRQEQDGVYEEQALLRPVALADRLLAMHARGGPGSPATQGSGPETGAAGVVPPDAAELPLARAGCAGIERFYLTSGSALQLRNAFRIQQNQSGDALRWRDPRLTTHMVEGLEIYHFQAGAQSDEEGGYFFGLAVDPDRSFINAEGDAATVIFTCAEAIGGVETSDALAYGNWVLSILAGLGLELYSPDEVVALFPTASQAIPRDLCEDWACSDQLGLARHSTVPGGAGQQSLALEAVSLGVALDDQGRVTEGAVRSEQLEPLAEYAIEISRVGVTDASRIVNLDFILSNHSNCLIEFSFDLTSPGNEPLHGRGISASVSAGTERSASATVGMAVSQAPFVEATPAVEVLECEEEPVEPEADEPANIDDPLVDDPHRTEVSNVEELRAALDTQDVDVIVLRPGSYSVADPVSIERSVELIGSGIGETVIEGNESPGPIWVDAPEADVVIRDMSVRYLGLAPANVITLNARTAELYNVRVSGGVVSPHAVPPDSPDGNGVFVRGATQASIVYSVLELNGNAGLKSGPWRGRPARGSVQMLGSLIRNNDIGAITLEGGIRVGLEGNRLRDKATIRFLDAPYGDIVGNAFGGSWYAGGHVNLSRYGGPANRLAFADNAFGYQNNYAVVSRSGGTRAHEGNSDTMGVGWSGLFSNTALADAGGNNRDSDVEVTERNAEYRRPADNEPEEEQPEPIALEREPYLPSQPIAFLPPQAAAENDPVGSDPVETDAAACSNLASLEDRAPDYDDPYLGSLRTQLLATDICDIIAAGLERGESYSSMMEDVAAEAAALANRLQSAEECLIEQSARAGLDDQAALREVYAGDFDFHGAPVVMASCARALIETLYARLAADETVRQLSSYTD